MIFMTVLLPIEANEGIEERLNVSLSRNEGRAVPVRRWSKRVGEMVSYSYSVVSSMPASARASMRSTQVPHLPQCLSPPL